MELPSKHLQEAVDQFSTLPGIGRRTALRLAMYLLRQPAEEVEMFGQTFKDLHRQINFCEKCHNITEEELCLICVAPKRDQQQICVVEDIRDIIAIENTSQYFGVYHVLGGVISPMDGIGPEDLNINSLLHRIEAEGAREIIMALSTTMEGDTTNFYLFKRLKDNDVSITTLARGVAIGDELEYTDAVTLGRSIANRLPYESSLAR